MSDFRSNTHQSPQSPYPDEEIDLKEVAIAIWSGKWLISLVTACAAAVSVTIALSLPNIYTANALLSPVESSSGISSLMKQYGSLARIAGVSLPQGEEGSRKQLGLQLMTSRSFVMSFIERRQILPELLAVESWNAGKDELVFNRKLYDSSNDVWLSDANTEQSLKPSPLEAHQAFLSLLNVVDDKRTGYVTVSIEHRSPTVAAKWVDWLVEDVNAVVKNQDVDEATKSITYLKQQAANTPLADLQVMFYGLIQSQIETIMLAEVRPEYVFKTIDPAVAPEVKTRPGRAIICTIGTILGGFFGVLIVLARHFVRL